MRKLNDLTALRAQVKDWRIQQQVIAFVPTMGNLHAGHLSLVERGQALADKVVVSIFVNPLKFNDKQALVTYLRTLEQDVQLLTELGCDLLFTPDDKTMYPDGMAKQSQIHVPDMDDKLCGLGRPGHFDGVATVVTKLLNMVQADIAVFGEKDYQQLCLVKKLVRDLNIPTDIVEGATCREQNGLAMSSRNNRLTIEQRQQAPLLYQQLNYIKLALLQQGEIDYRQLCKNMENTLRQQGFEPEYVDIRCADNLVEAIPKQDKDLRILTAAKLGNVRLIDNLACHLATE